jgi:hypothetical protein
MGRLEPFVAPIWPSTSQAALTALIGRTVNDVAVALHPGLAYGGLRWLRPKRNGSGRQEARPKPGAAQVKMPCCGDGSSVDGEACGN